LDGFIETDEIVKRNLDRKDKVQQIRQQVDDVIKRSLNDVRNRSPARAARENPQQQQFQVTQSLFQQDAMRGSSSPLRRGTY